MPGRLLSKAVGHRLGHMACRAVCMMLQSCHDATPSLPPLIQQIGRTSDTSVLCTLTPVCVVRMRCKACSQQPSATDLHQHPATSTSAASSAWAACPCRATALCQALQAQAQLSRAT